MSLYLRRALFLLISPVLLPLAVGLLLMSAFLSWLVGDSDNFTMRQNVDLLLGLWPQPRAKQHE